MNKEKIIKGLFSFSTHIRYIAIYWEDDLVYRQKDDAISNASSAETDRFEELLVNPTLLKLAEQRGNIDCGGLGYLIITYGNFYQLVKSFSKGHLSICLDKEADLNELPKEIFSFIGERFHEFK